MISHSSIAPPITTNNNTDDHTINSFKPMNYLNLPIEIHHKIFSFFTVNTLLSLRKTAKKFYDIITPEIMRSKIYQENIPSNSTLYSISCYENFIVPLLKNINPQFKKNISKYLAQAKNNNFSFKKVSHFIGSEIVMLNHQFKKKIFIAKNINLESNDLELFAISKLSNNCVFSTPNGLVILYSFSANNTLEKIAQFHSNESQASLERLAFSPKNNLIVLTGYSELLLWKLNLNADPLIKNEVLWKLNLVSTYRSIIMFQNETQFICSSFRITTCIWNIDDKYPFDSKQPIKNFLNIDNNNDYYILDIAISSNNNCIALVNNGSGLKLFSRTNNQTQFSEDSIAQDIDNQLGRTLTYEYNSRLQLNAKGNICAHSDYYSLTLLKKFNGIWHNILYLDNAAYLSVELSPYDTHLYFVKNSHRQNELKAISIKDIGLNSITSDNNKRKYNNYYLDNIDGNTIHHMHPTGLAIVLFNSDAQTLKLYHLKK